jgi:predicted phage tail protein
MASIRLTGDMKQKDFGERLQASQSARQAMMAKFRQRPGPDDPAVSERRLARAAVSAAREGRLADRETKRLAEEAELATVREAQAADQVAQERRAAVEKEANDAKLETERKAARDARYAARKARK